MGVGTIATTIGVVLADGPTLGGSEVDAGGVDLMLVGVHVLGTIPPLSLSLGEVHSTAALLTDLRVPLRVEVEAQIFTTRRGGTRGLRHLLLGVEGLSTEELTGGRGVVARQTAELAREGGGLRSTVSLHGGEHTGRENRALHC
jgi:hypothetical protein